MKCAELSPAGPSLISSYRVARPIDGVDGVLAVGAERLHVGITLIDVFGHRALNDQFEARRYFRVELARSHRILVEDGQDRRLRSLATKRRHACNRGVKHCSDAVDVRAIIGTFTARLLGRHVRWRAQNYASARQIRRIGAVQDPRQAEVEHLRVRVLWHTSVERTEYEDILWLQVAVNDAFGVRFGE